MKEVAVTCEDSYELKASVFLSKSNSVKGTVVIASALGVSQTYYAAFANFLSDSGFHAISFDYRGTGLSIDTQKEKLVSLAAWGQQDIDAVFKYALENESFQFESKQLPIHLIGHSIGGQVLGLAKRSLALSSACFVACSAPHWSRWQSKAAMKMLFLSYGFLPLMSKLSKTFPAQKVGLGNMPLPSKVVSEWAKWMRDTEYVFNKKLGLDLSIYSSLTMPILSYGFSDDDLAPEVNIKYLLQNFSGATVKHRQVTPEDVGAKRIGHTGFFKDKFAGNMWSDFVGFISK